MSTTTTASMFDSIYAARGAVKLAAEVLHARGDAGLEHLAGALDAAALILDQLADDALTAGDTFTKPRRAARAPR